MAISPMMQHYLATKKEYPDCILFYRLGDFYEMFFEDAKIVSKELELTLTGKNCGLPERAPMCGVPFHAADAYIAKLVANGHRVAICEQMEDPKQAKGIVKREVIRVVTPGTILSPEELDETKNNYIMSIAALSDTFGLCTADITTGTCLVTEVNTSGKLADEIQKYSPAEIIYNRNLMISGFKIEELKNRLNFSAACRDEHFDPDRKTEKLFRKHFSSSADLSAIAKMPAGAAAAAALFSYLLETQKTDLDQMRTLTPYYADTYMLLDAATRRNLELLETQREGRKKGSLLGVLDKTRTAMGARKLRAFIEQPLISKKRIEDRLAAVDALFSQPMIRDEIREYLQPIYDLERLASRAVYLSANPRDLVALRTSMEMLPFLRQLLDSFSKSDLLQKLKEDMDPLEDLHKMIAERIQDDPPLAQKEGGIIKDGFHEAVDGYRQAKKDGRQWLMALEEEEREKTGIKNLRIRYNKVFGYCIEVTNSFKDRVPDYYIRRQTLTNAERYTTEKLNQIQEKILGAEEHLNALEYELFAELRQTIADNIGRIQKSASAVAILDVLSSFAYVSERNRYIRPRINEKGRIQIRDGRHPVIEAMMPEGSFISNDTLLDMKKNRMAVITGPNMAGKSTYMRQVALIVLMAQIGCFVPAAEAEIGLTDRIFTRVGASDDLASGQSTFMVEMSEVANILRSATSKSLLILDEIGRGTSTFDGLAIAWAVIEYVADLKNLGAKTLFATHYHELTELEGKLSGVKNYCIAVREKGDDIVFLRKIILGGADKSYGIQVAKLAGLPSAVVSRAKTLVEQLSANDITDTVKGIASAKTAERPHYDAVDLRQMTFSDTFNAERLAKEIEGLNLQEMTPLDALNELSHLQNQWKNRWISGTPERKESS